MVKLLGAGKSDATRTLAALDRSLAIIEFDTRGRIVDANQNFCDAMGYARADIVGRHHSLFVDDAEAQGADYAAFWAKLSQGEADSRVYRRLAKGGREVWIQAWYSPVKDRRGEVTGVVKVATVITEEIQRQAEQQSRLEALDRVQAVIEFDLNGMVLTANANFLNAFGYELSEIQGQHHSLFAGANGASGHGGGGHQANSRGDRGGDPSGACPNVSDLRRVRSHRPSDRRAWRRPAGRA